MELRLREIPFTRQPAVAVDYKGHIVGEGRLDLLVGSALIVELKAVENWLRMNLGFLDMTVKTLEMQKSAMQALQESAARPEDKKPGKDGKPG